MTLRCKVLAIAAVFVFASAAAFFIYFSRPPVLIVRENSAAMFYGESGHKGKLLRASFELFRQVKEVAVADDSGDDILQFAIGEVSAKPFCVIFPLRFAGAARFYREQNPQVPVILLEGRGGGGENPAFPPAGGNAGGYFIYKTDVAADFYAAGLAAAALDNNKNGKIAVFLEHNLLPQAQEAFLRALNDIGKPLETRFFSSFDQFTEMPDLSCAVLAGAGAEFFETNFNIPLIFFTWIDLSMLPSNVVMAFSDSPLAQVARVVRMASSGADAGLLPSKREILPAKGIDREIIKNLRNIERN